MDEETLVQGAYEEAPQEAPQVAQADSSAQQRLETLNPALETLYRHFQVEAGDDAALAQAVAEQLGPEAGIQAHFRELERQSEVLRQVFPGFDLARELCNPIFARLTAPGTGIGVEDAFYAIHRGAIQRAAMEAASRHTAQKLSRSIQSAAQRPVENGTGTAPAGTLDYRQATAQQREALKERIRKAGAKGEKIYP